MHLLPPCFQAFARYHRLALEREMLTRGREQGYDFVAYPNRDSVPFREFYKIPEAETIIRGSLKYEGNPAFIKAFADAGWLDAEEKEWLKPGITWAEITQRVTSAADISVKYALLRIIYMHI